ncbi:MAG: hypothetical protein HUJ25_07360 [Crocinitomicaceae bacterium]|nr:hypothetical protein [Crocinitomicaceae bacterium]
MRHLLFSLFVFTSMTSFSQSVEDMWKPILKHDKLATYFSGMWESLGINVKETGEKITVLHQGDHFDLKKGVDEDNVDYNVFLKEENISNMAKHGEDGKIGEYESYKIMSVLFTPFVKAALKHPMMNKSCQMKLANIENHVHVYLQSPTNEEYAAHTMMFINKQWVVVEGIHGEAKRVFKMSPEQAIVYQKEAFKAQKLNTRKGWRKFKKFYLDWRKEVSVPVKDK